jgi:intracellular sulfur oxidation DsrE/DsrF family protein
MVTSADGKELTESRRIYLVATGPARMQGQKYNNNRTQLAAIGQGKVEMQVLEGSVILKGLTAAKIQAIQKKANGLPGTMLKVQDVPGGVGCIIDLSQLRSPVVEITIQR